ncbi:hypothetical protein HK102_002461 [Quaeritorhiza haematococci]|nr:hypothetical protein HK102_002461 [Quaeritorhiza haematococci]
MTDNLSLIEVTANLLSMCSDAIKSDIEVWKAKRDKADAAYAHFLNQFFFEFDRGDGDGSSDDEEQKRRCLQFESTIPDPSTVDKALVYLPVKLKYRDQYVQVPLKIQDVKIFLDTWHVLKPFSGEPDQWHFGGGRFRVVPCGLPIDEGLDCGELAHWENLLVLKEVLNVWRYYLIDVKQDLEDWQTELRGEVVVG